MSLGGRSSPGILALTPMLAASIVPFLWAVGDPSARLMFPSSIQTMTVSDAWLTWNDGSDPPRLRGLPRDAIPVSAH